MRGVHAVIGCGDADAAAVDHDPGALHALGCGEREAAVIDLQDGVGVHGVVICLDIKAAARNVEIAQGIIIVVFGVEPVLASAQGEASVRDGEAVLGRDGVLCGLDRVAAAGDRHLVLTHDAVARRGCNLQRTAAVEGQVVFGVDHAVYLAVVDLGKASAG